ncbi:hypothetical protein [Cribrihabitans pelagius]|uniref:hypothetical protein n=1 Tax=Cribrihabitans pelagius TaxID=1765746 RepID=UPI003B5A604C
METQLRLLAIYPSTDGSPPMQFGPFYGTLEPATGIGNGDFLPASVCLGEPGLDLSDGEQRALAAMFGHRSNALWSLGVNAGGLKGEAEYQLA